MSAPTSMNTSPRRHRAKRFKPSDSVDWRARRPSSPGSTSSSASTSPEMFTASLPTPGATYSIDELLALRNSPLSIMTAAAKAQVTWNAPQILRHSQSQAKQPGRTARHRGGTQPSARDLSRTGGGKDSKGRRRPARLALHDAPKFPAAFVQAPRTAPYGARGTSGQ